MEALFLFAEADVSSLCNVRLALEQHSAAFVRRAAAAWVARLPSLPLRAFLLPSSQNRHRDVAGALPP